VAILPEQNLRSKYNAKWALITGGSSGIGKAMAVRLAEQGLSICIAAFPNSDLDTTIHELQTRYPTLEFRGIGVDLSGGHEVYMEAIEKGTEGIDVQVLFCNAGYVFYSQFSAQENVSPFIKNFECIFGAHIRITGTFVRRMRKSQLRGCVMFTSSMVFCLYLFSTLLLLLIFLFSSRFCRLLFAFSSSPYSLGIL